MFDFYYGYLLLNKLIVLLIATCVKKIVSYLLLTFNYKLKPVIVVVYYESNIHKIGKIYVTLLIKPLHYVSI